MAIESGSQWTLTGDATVGELQVLNSGVALSDGSGRFNTLTVDGDLHSAGATFLFQGTLAGDDSAMDRLHVRGDSSGDALIAVKNIGGVGAPTVDGIALIEIDGASLASYTLSGRAVGGSYEYFLFQGGLADPSDGNWYLRSQWFDICQDNPAAPGCVVDPGRSDPIRPIRLIRSIRSIRAIRAIRSCRHRCCARKRGIPGQPVGGDQPVRAPHERAQWRVRWTASARPGHAWAGSRRISARSAASCRLMATPRCCRSALTCCSVATRLPV
jgi:outer membrane autotransporter protein